MAEVLISLLHIVGKVRSRVLNYDVKTCDDTLHNSPVLVNSQV